MSEFIEGRPLEYEELVAAKDRLDKDDLVAKLLDGRGHVRANALLGLAALGHGGSDYTPLLRDGEPKVARAAAQALFVVAKTQKDNVVAIAEKLDGARPEVAAMVARMFAQLIGVADAELTSALDTSASQTAGAIIAACEEAGVRGLHLLRKAARDGRTRVRINAVKGVAMLGILEQLESMELLADVERTDDVSDVRSATRRAIAELAARTKSAIMNARQSAGPQPPRVPELEKKDLTPEQAAKAAAGAPIEDLLHALVDDRAWVRLNAVRMIGAKGVAQPATARGLAVLLRDSESSVRADVATALGNMGMGAVVTAPSLIAALGDADPTVVDAAQATLAKFGGAAAIALVEGLDTPNDAHGARVATLIGKLADGPELLREALASTTMEVRLHAAIALGELGPRAGEGALTALGNTAIGGNARLKNAIAAASEKLAPRPDRTPPKMTIDGWYERPLATMDKQALQAIGAGGLAAHLVDAWPHVRANAATALGIIGGERQALIAVLRDREPSVRLAVLNALEKSWDDDLAYSVAMLLGDHDPAVAAKATALLEKRPVGAALAHALEQGVPALPLVLARPDAVDVLIATWPRAMKVAASGFVMLGSEKLGAGRATLEAARTHENVAVRECAHATLRAIDGDPIAPPLPAVKGFDTEIVDVKEKLDPATVAPFLIDGRAIVRANAATALGAAGATAMAGSIGALMTDDDARVRVAAARALDKLGDDAVVANATYLVAAMRDAAVADAVAPVLASRKGKVEAALLAGLETSDEAHGLRVAQMIADLPNAKELLFAAYDGEAQNVTINAAFGIGLLGPKRAGEPGRRRLQNGLRGPITRTHHACRKALTMFGG